MSGQINQVQKNIRLLREEMILLYMELGEIEERRRFIKRILVLGEMEQQLNRLTG